jgi:putative ABC transport system permease protein
MTLFHSMLVAFRSLMANKLRSALTMLGIIIGVGAVIALVAAGEGAQAQVRARFESLGSNILVISPRAANFRGVSQATASASSLTNNDVTAILQFAGAVVAIAPLYSTRATLANGDQNMQSTMLGVTPAYLTVGNWTLAQGRFIDDLDSLSLAKVAVLGATVAQNLFGTLANPVGMMVKINRQDYQVVGVLKSKGISGGVQSQDDQIYIPLSTAQILFGGAGNTSLNSISVQVVSADKMALAKAEITAILRARRGLTAQQNASFTVSDQTQIAQSAAATTETFTVLLSSIAAISLVVGGIGIMNIMLVSITERTREIGIRKAVGAKRRDILMQFLTEALVLSLIGGILGILVGIVGAQIITPLLGGTQSIVTAQSVILALGVSIGIGLFFGLYPAYRAARLNPIDALRYE